MRVKIVQNIMDVVDDYFSGKENHRTDDGFILLCDRISGKEVNIHFINGGAFESEDNMYWLPECCWEEIK